VTDSWYFAYGSNLDPDRKVYRTGQIREARVARLDGYDFAFNKRGDSGTGYANIVRQDAKTVWGVVYRCNPKALATLDRYEGVQSGHYRRTVVRVRCKRGGEVDAVTYIAGESFIDDSLVPSDDYLELVIRGARHHGLPDEYIRRIERAARPGKEGGTL
jgi:gamma-glutamylcyclotransferase (GGCT)/AIG2-like uncharacterized protein YtfP